MHGSADALFEGFIGSEMIHDVCGRFHCEESSVLQFQHDDVLLCKVGDQQSAPDS
jgi:hypothetical protein